MINLILLFPLLACLILLIFKKEKLNNLMLNTYALLHFIGTMGFCFGKDLFPLWKTCSFFSVNNKNIIFLAVNNKYLATIAGIDADNSIIKITPCNEVYFFQPGILLGMFKYIELNQNTEIK